MEQTSKNNTPVNDNKTQQNRGVFTNLEEYATALDRFLWNLSEQMVTTGYMGGQEDE